MTNMFDMRLVRASDVDLLADVYADAVRMLGPQLYSAEQVEAWAAAVKQPAFRDFVLRPMTFVAVADDRPIGFSGVEEDGHVASLYVAGAWTRRGVGSALLTRVLLHAESQSIRKLHTEASRFSRPLFARFGFDVAETQHVTYNDVVFERWLMRKDLDQSG